MPSQMHAEDDCVATHEVIDELGNMRWSDVDKWIRAEDSALDGLKSPDCIHCDNPDRCRPKVERSFAQMHAFRAAVTDGDGD